MANSADFDEVYTKTIYHEKSVKNQKGADKWLHPDIVGVKFNYKFYKTELMEFNRKFENLPVIIYSFEMKKELTIGNLKECYFQAVSNSSWANEGYLVALDISKDDELRSAILRLNSSFGIGVISLNSIDPAQSEVIATAKHKENIDIVAANELCDRNCDFQDFLKAVCKYDSIDKDLIREFERKNFDKIEENIDEYIKNHHINSKA